MLHYSDLDKLHEFLENGTLSQNEYTMAAEILLKNLHQSKLTVIPRFGYSIERSRPKSTNCFHYRETIFTSVKKYQCSNSRFHELIPQTFLLETKLFKFRTTIVLIPSTPPHRGDRRSTPSSQETTASARTSVPWPRRRRATSTRPRTRHGDGPQCSRKFRHSNMILSVF